MKIGSSIRRACILLAVVSCALISGTTSAWASSEDVTHDVNPVKTQHQWFYWPGWAFVLLTIAVIGIVLSVWLKSVVLPRYRGRKVTS